MIKKRKTERRQYPRLGHQLPLKVAANGYDFVTSTEDVSCVGACCRINKYVPPFTRVMIKMSLPIHTDNLNKNYEFECKGVIVRVEDTSDRDFNIAIFFNGIKDDQRKKIAQYINQFLPNNNPALV